MKVLFCLVAVALIGYVSSENCPNGLGDCTVTQCDAVTTLACVNSMCVCQDNHGGQCTGDGDCHQHNCGPNHHGHAVCQNGNCHCPHHNPGK